MLFVNSKAPDQPRLNWTRSIFKSRYLRDEDDLEAQKKKEISTQPRDYAYPAENDFAFGDRRKLRSKSDAWFVTRSIYM